MVTAAAALMAIHAVLSFLGFVAAWATADGDLVSSQVEKVAYRAAAAAVAVVSGIGAQMAFAGHGTAVLVVAALLSFATSGYFAYVWRREGDYSAPVAFTVLPAASLVLVLLG